MPRPQEFEEDKVLHSAMRAFRTHGYRGLSIKGLEQATGLSSGSLYNSFGGKEAMFARALEHYNLTVVEARIKKHLSEAEPKAGLNALLLSLLEEPDSDGCLLTNSAIEFADRDMPAAAPLRAGFARLTAAFEGALAGIPVSAPPLGALRLLTFYQGLLVLIRLGHDRAALRGIIPQEIDAITGAKND